MEDGSWKDKLDVEYVAIEFVADIEQVELDEKVIEFYRYAKASNLRKQKPKV